MRIFQIAAIVSVLTFVFYLADIGSYGATWDELIFHQSTGERYFEFLKLGILDPIVKDDESAWFPPMGVTIGYFFKQNGLLAKYLPDGIDRFHIAGIVFGSLTAGIVLLISYLLTEDMILSVLAAIILATYPQFVTQAHNNVRDIGLTFFYAWTILMMLWGVKKQKFIFGAITSGFLAGLTAVTKQNGVFLLIISAIFFGRFYRTVGAGKLVLMSILEGVIFIWTFIAFWPYLWVETINHILNIWKFLTDPAIIAGSTVFFDKAYTSMKNIPFYYPWVMLFLLNPPILALMAGAGLFLSLFYFIKRDEKGLVFLWIFIPLSRFFIKTSSISYDQIRHFFEVVPAISIAAVLFIDFLIIRFKEVKYSRLALIMCLAVTAGYNIFLTLRYRPYGTAYFNMFAGSPNYVNHAFDVEYYGNVYREAVRELKSRYSEKVRFYTAGLGAHILQANGFLNPLTDEVESDFEYAIFMNKQSS